jgi:uncharacterized protein (TIGR00106 family)
MEMLAELRITPVDSDGAFLREVAIVVRVLADSPLSYRVNAMGTTLEGDLDAILDVVRQCHRDLAKDSSRTLIELSLDDRPAKPGELERSLRHLREATFGAPIERLLPPR